MEKRNPRVTIIMATYNRAHFIVETLYSIQKQTFKDWECLIIDDGGTDNTKQVITQILDEDRRFQLLKRPENYLKGLPGSRNYGLDIAKGDLIIFFDDDDIVHPMNLELCVKELANLDYSFCRYLRDVFTDDFNYIFDLTYNYNTFLITTKDVESVLKHKLPFNSCSVMWRKSCFQENRFVEHLMYAEEWELYSRILSNGFAGLSINKILFFGRKHPNSNTGEFYKKNFIRENSNKDAILLVLKNLKEKNLINYSIIRYFVAISYEYSECKLFYKIMKELEFKGFDYLKWQLFYSLLPLRFNITKLKKRLIKNN